MKQILLLLIIAIGTIGCEHEILAEDNASSPYDPQKVICFVPTPDATDNSARGTHITSATQMTDIGVHCSHTGSNDWDGASSAPIKMFNTRLARNVSNNNWEYSNAPVGWGAASGNDRYTFFAYAPFATTANGIIVNGNALTAGIPAITYTAPTDVTKQPDLMLSMPRYNIRPATSMVSLQMKHALTAVSFQIQGNDEKIKSITLSGVATSGQVVVDGSNIVWTPKPATGSFSPPLNYDSGQAYYTAISTLSTNLLPGNGHLMMIPQTLGANAKLTITLADNTTREINLNSYTWVAGKKVTYNILMTLQGIITTSISTLYVPATGANQLSENIQLSITPANATWKLTSSVPWMRITTNANGSGAATSITGTGPMTIYTIIDANTAAFERTAKIYAYDNIGQTVTNVIQFHHVNISTTTQGGTKLAGVTSYVGAFWRANQRGERIIRIPIGSNTGNVGSWSASVVWTDSNWPLSDINLSTVASSDASISHTQNQVPADAESYMVLENKRIVTGVVAANGTIYFRIGLKSAFTASSQTPARYAVIALSYNNRTKTQLLFLRQGENDDFLMRNVDPSVGTYTNSSRPLACKISPYNLTVTSAATWMGGPLLTDHPIILLRGGVFTQYPTQAGALFQWTSTALLRRAYHPTTPVLGISGYNNTPPYDYWKMPLVSQTIADISELCPLGYRRINDGSESTASTLTAATSEIRQSLLHVTQNGISSSLDNTTAGYYADGFFDRRYISTSSSGITQSVVSFYPGQNTLLNTQVAYIGVLFYNPINAASLFFPSVGTRSSNGDLSNTGQYGYYWTSSSKISGGNALSMMGGITNPAILGLELNRYLASSLRCVRE